MTHKGELMDQYKMFQKTSEDLVARRQSVSSFYISVNSALVALLGIVMGLVEMPTKIYVMLFMCLTGIILADFFETGTTRQRSSSHYENGDGKGSESHFHCCIR